MADAVFGNILRVPREQETLRARTVEILRNAILQLHFKPGQRLIERDLCEQTGVSRTSIREALRHLESEGLIVTIPNKGPVVATVTREDARQIYEVRGQLEAYICRLFTERASDAAIDALESSMDALEQAIRRKDHAAAQLARGEFFNILYDGCDNEVACSISRTLRARVNYLAAEGTRRWDLETVSRRRQIVDAIRKRDPEGASDAFLRHLNVALEIADHVIESASANEVVDS